MAKGCVVSALVMEISNRREIPCATQSRRSTMNRRMAWRGVVGAASQIHRQYNHGETGKGDPFWFLNWRVTVWPNHGGFQCHFTGVRSRIAVLPNHGTLHVGGPRNGARYWTGTPTLAAAEFREPKRLRSFGNYLSIQSQKTRSTTWLRSLWLWSLRG